MRNNRFIFRRISYRIALQFTAFVFVLLLINGAVFLAVDFKNAERQSHTRIVRLAQFVIDQAESGPVALAERLPPVTRDRVRIVHHDGSLVYGGAFFSDIPFVPKAGFVNMTIDNDDYTILTQTINHSGELVGYLQVADLERLQMGDLPLRAFLYLVVSAAISALTFFVGLFFARSSLLPAEQMFERLEQFTQDASHELRTPIAALSSSLDLALRSKQYREGIVSAKEDLQEVSLITERLLELAVLDKFTVAREPVDLSLLLETSVEKIRALAAEKSVTIATEIAPLIQVRGDASLVRQVVSNLLSNAIKFSKSGGGTIRVTLTKKLLSIEDAGIGIAASSLPHIFDRFYQAETSRSKDGYGLGLALVKRIVDLHGWRIGVKSEEGKGTTFTIRFL